MMIQPLLLLVVIMTISYCLLPVNYLGITMFEIDAMFMLMYL